MASPRVFISSTCYDLSEIRDGLVSFFSNFGFDVVLSERGDVFYHPDLHTHESCTKETSNCQLFILIIGGRFGGKYLHDKKKSITNAEFSAAKQTKTPVFAFVKSSVLSDHNVWQKNKNMPFASDIEYPSIEKKEHSRDIFDFIDEVRLSSTNNGLFSFNYARDLQDILRKQLAGMLFDFLKDRTLEKRLDDTSAAVENLSSISNKIEELVKKIYKNVDEKDAEEVIDEIDRRSKAEDFFKTVARAVSDDEFLLNDSMEEAITKDYPTFVEFLIDAGFFSITEGDIAGAPHKILQYDPGAEFFIALGEPLTKRQKKIFGDLEETYSSFVSLPPESKRDIFKRYSYTSRAPVTEIRDDAE